MCRCVDSVYMCLSVCLSLRPYELVCMPISKPFRFIPGNKHLCIDLDQMSSSATPTLMRLPISSLQYTCSDPDVLTKALDARYRVGWYQLCRKWLWKHVDEEYSRYAAMLIWSVGRKYYGYERLFKNLDYFENRTAHIEDCAVLTMWLLEEVITHPWKILRRVVLRLKGPPELPHRMVRGLLEPDFIREICDEMHEELNSRRRCLVDMLLICHECHRARNDTNVLHQCTCGEARYCSHECQKAHWPIHKDRCREIRNTGQGGKPDREHNVVAGSHALQ